MAQTEGSQGGANHTVCKAKPGLTISGQQEPGRMERMCTRPWTIMSGITVFSSSEIILFNVL